nr:elongation factor 1-delta-like [Symphalangus syndactylus]
MASAPAKKPATPAEDHEDNNVDLFGSDGEEDKEAALLVKTSILLDVKPWDDETDMAQLEVCVRSIQLDRLVWGASKVVPMGYGIQKLQIQCVVEDDKLGTDLLEEEITKFEEHVQTVDITVFNKIRSLSMWAHNEDDNSTQLLDQSLEGHQTYGAALSVDKSGELHPQRFEWPQRWEHREPLNGFREKQHPAGDSGDNLGCSR